MPEFTIRAGDEVTFSLDDGETDDDAQWRRRHNVGERRETGIAVGFQSERPDHVPTEILVRLAGDEHLRIGVESVRGVRHLYNLTY